MIRLSPISRPSDLPVLNPLAELKPEPASPPGGPAELPLARGRERSAGSGEPGRSMPRLSASRTTGPIARSGHRAACAACAALLLVAVLGTALPAAAQSVVTFVSNAGQGRLDQYDTNFGRAQAFTTGSNASGYTLSSAEFVSGDSQGDDAAVSLCTVNISNHPTSSCTALSPPQSFTSGTLVFTAPANTSLEADTTYTLLMTSPGGQSLKLNGTNSDGEDSGGTAGWSIANESHDNNGGWSSRMASFYITIKGTAKTQGNATGAPGITGTAHVGETLTATPGTIADPDGLHTTWFSNAATTVQWIRVDGGSDSEISSATDRTYTLVAADEGKQVKVKVDFTDDDVNDESRTSDAYPAGSTVLPADSVPSDWSLIPTGLSTGDTFRLLFLSSTKRNASSTDIADYNTFVQNLAAAGHTDIRTYSAGFRVVGCTAAVDARDNTKTTYTTTDKGVPVYWLNGAKAADQYEDFYDGSWDDEANEKNESGADGLDTSQNGNRPFTGCKHDGTEAVNSFDDSRGLGANPVRVAVPNSSGSGHGPISSNSISEGNANTRPMYGLSAVFQVAADTTPPTLTSAEVDVLEGRGVDLEFSENLQRSNPPPASAFTVTVDGSAVTVSSVGVPGSLVPQNQLFLTVSPVIITQGQAVVVSYTDPTTGDDASAIQDAAGNDALSFTTGSDGVPAVTNASPVVPAATEVPSDWSLIPTGLSTGDTFRLLFLSSTKRNASSTDIADYNTFVQTRAAAGHTDIQAYGAGFRVVGCTAAVDARDNTSTTYTATDKGVPIYWLNGAKAADEYEDFYDGSWDDEVNDKNESGTNSHDTSQQANYPFTGCNHDGTESFSGDISRALGELLVRPGRPTFSNAILGPLSSDSIVFSTLTRPMYGLSAVFQVAADTTPPTLTSAGVNEAGLFILLGFSENLQLSNLPPASAFTVTAGGSAFTVGGVLPRPGAPDLFLITVSPAIRQGQAIVVTYTDPTAGDDATAFQDTAGNDAATFTTGSDNVPAVTNASTVLPAAAEVPADWSLKPTAVTAGTQFRLLFLSSTKRDGSSTDIATYNTFIQTRAAAGHADIQAYSAGFRVVGCTEDTDARDNTETTYTGTAKGVPIYWLDGAKAADEYEDFYDGSWDDEANDKNESGTDAHDTSQTANWPWTGCKHNGTEYREFAGIVSRGLGSDDVRHGRPDSSTVDHGPLNGLQNGPKAETRPLYGLSALFQVAAAVVVPNNPPAGAPTITGTAQVGETLTAVTTAIMDADGLTTPDYVYQWIRVATDNTETYIASARASTYTLVEADQGATIKVLVGFTDDANNSETLTSAATAAVAAAPDTTPPTLVSAVVEADGNILLRFSENLGAAPVLSAFTVTADGSPVTVVSTENATLADDGIGVETSPLIRRGQAVVVMYSDPTAGDDALAIQDIAGNDAADFTTGMNGVPPVTNNSTVNNPATGAPAITGTAQVGETLTATVGTIADVDGLPNPFLTDANTSFQWVRVELGTETNIPSATASTYTLVREDWRSNVGVKVSFRDAQGNSEEPLASTLSGIIARPANTAATGEPGITGTAQVGQTLTATVGSIADVDGLRNPFLTDGLTSFQWIRVATDNTETNIASATASTYTLVTGDAGTTIKVTVGFVDNYDYDEMLTSAETGAVSAAANTLATGAPTITGTAQVGQTLTAVTTAIMDAEGLTNVSYMYQWIRVATDNTETNIASATASTYTLVEADQGATIKVQVRFNDDADNPETLTSTATAAVAAAPNTAATGAPTITGTAQVGQTLTAVTTAIMDADGLTNVSYTYQWIRTASGTDTNIAGAMASTHTLVTADQGTTIKVKVSFDDDAGYSETLTSAATAAVAAATNTAATGAPTITGTAQVGQTLTAVTTAIMDAEGLINVSYMYQWIRTASGTDTNIAGAMASTYTLVEADQGATIKVRVSFTDDANNNETLTSAATAAVSAAANTAATGAPTITGTAQVGQTLTAVTTAIMDDDGLTSVSYTYQWIRVDGGTETNISGATASTHTLVAADQGTTIKVRVSFTDDASNAETLTSAATAAVAAAANTPATGAPTITGTAQVGQTLTAGTTAIMDANGLTTPSYTYQWIRVATDNSETNIASATASTYTLVDADLGTTIKVKVSFTDDASNAETLTSTATAAVAAAVPNNPPAFSADTAARSVAENTAAGQNVGAALTATDADSDTLTYTLEGADAASFDIVSGSGQIQTRTGVTYNHEAQSTYTVIVKADDSNGGTDTVTVTIAVTDVDEPPGIPAAPTVTATAGSTTSLDVTWTAPANTGPDIDNYDLIYRESGSGPFTSGPQNVTGASAAIGSLAPGTAYQVQVRATNAEGDSDWSLSGTGQTGNSAPGAPTVLSATASGTTRIDLSWTAPASTGGSAITGYRIEVSSNGGSSWSDLVANTSNTTTTYAHTGLAAGETRHYRVSAINANGAGTASNVANATTGQTTVTFGASSYTAAEGGATATVAVQLSAAASASVTIPLTKTHRGGATAADYSGVPSNVTFTAGQTRQTFTVTATDDSDKDGGESVQLGFGSLPGGYAPGARRTATVTLVDDDANLIVNFGTERHTTVKVRESDVWHRFIFMLSTSRYGPPNGNPQQPVTIPLVVTHRGTASQADYEGIPASVTFRVGESVTDFRMRAKPDRKKETGEGLRLDFGPLPAGVRAGTWGPYETIEFLDEYLPDLTVWFGASSYTAAEGGADARVSIHLSEKVDVEPLVVRLSVQPGGGATSGDYSVPSSVRFAVGEQTKTIQVAAVDDTDDDDGESVTLSFVNAPNDRLITGSGPVTATVALEDNDGAGKVEVSFAAATYTATEGGSGATVRVELDKAPGRSVTVPLAVTHLGGALPADYSGIPANVTFGANQRSRTFTVTATNDTDSDGGESVPIGFGTLPDGVLAGRPAATVVTLKDGTEQTFVVSFDSSPTYATEVREGNVGKRISVFLGNDPWGSVWNAEPKRPVTIPLVVTRTGGATAADHTAIPASVTFGVGRGGAGFDVRAIPDGETETGEGLRIDFGELPPGVTKGSWGHKTIAFVDAGAAAASVSVSGPLLTLSYPGALDAGSAPSGADFVVLAGPRGGEAVVPVTSVWVDGNAVLLALARPVAARDTVTLTYLMDAMHPIRGAHGLLAAPLVDEPVRNETGIPPERAAVPDGAQAGARPERLDLSSRNLTDLSALAGLSGVRELDLRDNAIADLSPLSGLSGLQVLDLSGNRIEELWPLAGLPALRRLNLSGNRIADIGMLSGLGGLQVLDLSGNRIEELWPLAGLPALQRLNLSGNRIADIGMLSGLGGLQVLDLSGNRIEELWPLAGLPALQRLNLSGNRITDIAMLSGLGGLQVLLLDRNRVADAGALSPLTGLANLGLSENRIEDIGLLGSLGPLRRLDLSGNAVADVSALGDVSELLWLRLSGNPVSDVAPLGRLEMLRWLWLDQGAATRMEALALPAGRGAAPLWIERVPAR